MIIVSVLFAFTSLCVPLDPMTLLHLHVDILAYVCVCVCVCVFVCVCVCMYHLPIVSLRSALHIELYSLHCSLISERVLLSLEVPKLLPLVPLIRLR